MKGKKITEWLANKKVVSSCAAIALAAVIGGVSLLGGEGGIAGCIFGVVLIGMLNNGLSLLSIPSTEHDLYKGVIIIAAVAFDMLSRTGGIRIFRKRAGGERA